MTKEQVSELARVIVNEEILSNWKFYVLIILLNLISSYFTNYISSYAKKRGERLATKADIDEIKKELAVTTEITEKIKNDIVHQVWHKQQIETIKRNKLEEYLQHIYVSQESLSADMNNTYFKTNEPVDTYAMSKATMLQKLYFPELTEEHSVCLKAHTEFHMWFAEGLKELITQKQNGEKTPIISSKHMEKYSKLLDQLNQGTLLIERKAEKISEEINVS